MHPTTRLLNPPVTGVGVDIESPVSPAAPITMNVFGVGNVFLGSMAVVVPATPTSQFKGVSATGPIERVTLTGFEGELFDDLTYGDCFLPVSIDLKPGSDPNCQNPRARGRVAVAIFGATDFDVEDIDVSLLDFGGASPVKCRVEQAVPSTDSQTWCATTGSRMSRGRPAGSDCGEVVLTGNLLDGTAIRGSDLACIPGEPACDAGGSIP